MTAIESSKNAYICSMDQICHSSKEHIIMDQLNAQHELSLNIAMELVIIIENSSDLLSIYLFIFFLQFNTKTKIGSDKDRTVYHGMLSSELNKLLNYYMSQYNSKENEKLIGTIENLENKLAESNDLHQTQLNTIIKQQKIEAEENKNRIGILRKEIEEMNENMKNNTEEYHKKILELKELEAKFYKEKLVESEKKKIETESDDIMVEDIVKSVPLLGTAYTTGKLLGKKLGNWLK